MYLQLSTGIGETNYFGLSPKTSQKVGLSPKMEGKYIGSATTQAIVVEHLVGTHTTDPKGAKLDTINRIFSRTLTTFLIVTKQDHVLFHSRDKTQRNNRHHRHFRNRPFRCCFK